MSLSVKLRAAYDEACKIIRKSGYDFDWAFMDSIDDDTFVAIFSDIAANRTTIDKWYGGTSVIEDACARLTEDESSLSDDELTQLALECIIYDEPGYDYWCDSPFNKVTDVSDVSDFLWDCAEYLRDYQGADIDEFSAHDFLWSCLIGEWGALTTCDVIRGAMLNDPAAQDELEAAILEWRD